MLLVPHPANVCPNNHAVCYAGKVEIGAFRTYPEGYTPPNSAPSEYQPIPLNKIEDFGVHADMYYSLEISIFKTSLDSQIIKLLWNKYWANTLSASPLLANEAFIGGQLEDMCMHPKKNRLMSLLSLLSPLSDQCPLCATGCGQNQGPKHVCGV